MARPKKQDVVEQEVVENPEGEIVENPEGEIIENSEEVIESPEAEVEVTEGDTEGAIQADGEGEVQLESSADLQTDEGEAAETAPEDEPEKCNEVVETEVVDEDTVSYKQLSNTYIYSHPGGRIVRKHTGLVTILENGNEFKKVEYTIQGMGKYVGYIR